MIEKTNNSIPKNSLNKKANLTDILCDIDTGYHFCFKTSKVGDLNKYGIGVSLYFRFVKYVALFFIFFAFLNIPILFLTFRSMPLKIRIN